MAITSQNYEGAMGGDLGLTDEYLLAEKKKMMIYDNKNFSENYSINIPQNNSKDQFSLEQEILYVAVSSTQNKIGIALGRYLLKDEKEINRLAFYSKSNETGKFQFEEIFDF